MTILTPEKLTELFSRPDPVEAEIIRRLGAGCVHVWSGDTAELPDMALLDLLAAAAGRLSERRADQLHMHLQALENAKAWDALETALEALVEDKAAQAEGNQS